MNWSICTTDKESGSSIKNSTYRQKAITNKLQITDKNKLLDYKCKTIRAKPMTSQYEGNMGQKNFLSKRVNKLAPITAA
ncbi:hypothetical protein [Pseudoalteromonas xiamenensis]